MDNMLRLERSLFIWFYRSSASFGRDRCILYTDVFLLFTNFKIYVKTSPNNIRPYQNYLNRIIRRKAKCTKAAWNYCCLLHTTWWTYYSTLSKNIVYRGYQINLDYMFDPDQGQIVGRHPSKKGHCLGQPNRKNTLMPSKSGISFSFTVKYFYFKEKCLL